MTDASAGKWDWFLLFLSPSLFSWCFILQAFNCFSFSPSSSVFVPHLLGTDIPTFCNNPECFLNFYVSTLDYRELFKGLGHHVKIHTRAAVNFVKNISAVYAVKIY